MDSHCRSLIKTVSYRVVSGLVTALVSLAVTGNIRLAAAIGVGDTVVKLGLYYLHERVWNRVCYGRAQPPEYEI
jgi:uncharacterized membrane protein